MDPTLRGLLLRLLRQNKALQRAYRRLLHSPGLLVVAVTAANTALNEVLATLHNPLVLAEINAYFSGAIPAATAANFQEKFAAVGSSRDSLLQNETEELKRSGFPLEVDLAGLLEIYQQQAGNFGRFVASGADLVNALTFIHGKVLTAAANSRGKSRTLRPPDGQPRRLARKSRLGKKRFKERVEKNLLPAVAGLGLLTANTRANTDAQSVSYLLGGATVYHGANFIV
jgi:hypothetical protein